MNMINVRRLTVMTFLGAGMLSGISAQVSPLQVDTLKETKIPAQWDLQFVLYQPAGGESSVSGDE